MKKSYYVYSAIIVFLVLVMIVGGIVQDKRKKKQEVMKCATNTLLAAGAVEYDPDKGPYQYDETEQVHKMDSSSIEELSKKVSNSLNLDEDSAELFNEAAKVLLEDATFQIIDTTVNGRNATVKIRIYYKDHQGDVELEYFYYDDEWMLSNSTDVIKSILIDGESYETNSEAVQELLGRIKGE